MRRDPPFIHIAVAIAALAALALVIAIDNTDLRVGLFGLAGTLAGALATFEGTQVSARRASRARARAAGRLLQEDVLFGRTRCLNALANKRFWAPRLDLRLEGWERYREDVALADIAEWEKIASAFEAMRAVQSKCNGRRSNSDERPEVGRLSEKLIEEYLARSDAAVDALRQLSGDRPPDETPVPDEGG